jgi:chemotaxis protein MotB
MAGKGRNSGATIVLKKEEVVEGGHHGGAWKVAYADFVTAMMAFFLLMWLLNATTEEQRRGLADYFAPTNVLGRAATGNGQPFGGRTVNSDGALASDNGALRVERGPAPARLDLDEEEGEAPAMPLPELPASAERAPGALGMLEGAPSPPAGTASSASPELAGAVEAREEQAREAARLADGALRAELARRERASFEQAAEELRAAVRDDPALAELARQLRVEQVPEGLRIQILDAERQPMFPLSSAQPNERARALLARVAQVVGRLPNAIAIAGHTDATPFRGAERSSWDLSADRANAVRRLLTEQGVNPGRLRSVSGLAEREPLLPEDPGAAANRRVAITLLRMAPEATQ